MLGAAEWLDERGCNYWCWCLFRFFVRREWGGDMEAQYPYRIANVTIVNSNLSIVPAVSVVENNHNDSMGASAKLRNISLRVEG